MKKIVILIMLFLNFGFCNMEWDCYIESKIKELKLFKPSEITKLKKYAEKHKCFIDVDPEYWAGCEYEMISLHCDQKQFNGLNGDVIRTNIHIRRQKNTKCRTASDWKSVWSL